MHHRESVSEDPYKRNGFDDFDVFAVFPVPEQWGYYRFYKVVGNVFHNVANRYFTNGSVAFL